MQTCCSSPVDLNRLAHVRHRQLFAYWRDKRRGARLPGRADIDPIEIPRHLPCLALIDVVRHDETLDFRYRLTGTEIVDKAGRDPTGKSFGQLYSGTYLQQAYATYRDIVRSGQPAMSQRVFPADPSRRFVTYDRLILPLAADGQTVDMLMLHVVFRKITEIDATA
jgi:hypothetical protein